MSAITIQAWSEGPDSLGKFRGHWHLIHEGEPILGTNGRTEMRYASAFEATEAANELGRRARETFPE